MLSSLRTPIAERPPHCLYNYSWVRGCWSLLARLSQSPGYSICCWELGPLPPVSEQTAALSYTCTSAASPGEAGILGGDTIEPPDSVSFKILTAASRCGIKILFHRIKNQEPMPGTYFRIWYSMIWFSDVCRHIRELHTRFLSRRLENQIGFSCFSPVGRSLKEKSRTGSGRDTAKFSEVLAHN
jgi:hypothetical protein